MGLFTELGPFLLNSQSLPSASGNNGTWRPLANPYSWSSEASLLVWEQPAGVGFSRCDVGGCEGFPWDDVTSADANLLTLLAFYNAYNEAAERPLYLAGESYAGIYVPLLAVRIITYNRNLRGEKPRRLQLRGVAVGNGCIGYGVAGACGIDSLDLFVTELERKAPGVDRSLLQSTRGNRRRSLSTRATAPHSKPHSNTPSRKTRAGSCPRGMRSPGQCCDASAASAARRRPTHVATSLRLQPRAPAS